MLPGRPQGHLQPGLRADGGATLNTPTPDGSPQGGPAGSEPGPGETGAPARGGTWAQVGADAFSFQAVTGGWWGFLETIVPAVVFIAVNTFAGLRTAVITSVAVALVAFAVRLVTRSAPTQAIAGLVGVGVCAAFAALSGEARNYFMPGFVTNIAYGGIALLSLIRLPAMSLAGRRRARGAYPLLGLLIGGLLGEGLRWREHRVRARTYWWLTAAFAGLFGLRLVVQVPLYLSAQVEALGVARLAMGVPMFVVLVWVCWWALRRPAAALPARAESG